MYFSYHLGHRLYKSPWQFLCLNIFPSLWTSLNKFFREFSSHYFHQTKHSVQVTTGFRSIPLSDDNYERSLLMMVENLFNCADRGNIYGIFLRWGGKKLRVYTRLIECINRLESASRALDDYHYSIETSGAEDSEFWKLLAS